MPKSPLESFFDRVFDAVEDAAESLIQDAAKHSRENIRRMARQLDQATVPRPRGKAPKPVPTAKKRATVHPGTGTGQSGTPQSQRPQKTLYDVLEVSYSASPETVSAAFRSLSSRFHPDNGKTGNAEKYKEITAAWSILKDPVKRKKYDRGIGIDK